MIWYIIAAISFLVMIYILVTNYIRDKRILKSKISETMSKDILIEVEDEEAAAHDRQKKFEDALKKAKDVQR